MGFWTRVRLPSGPLEAPRLKEFKCGIFFCTENAFGGKIKKICCDRSYGCRGQKMLPGKAEK